MATPAARAPSSICVISASSCTWRRCGWAFTSGREPLLAALNENRPLSDFEYLAVQARAMLDDLGWWATTLKAGRDALAKPA